MQAGGSSVGRLAGLIKACSGMVFFGGAGVSTESGIPDFRSETGLFMAKSEYGRTPEELLSHSTLCADPEAFFGYFFRHLIHAGAKPNGAHKALTALEGMGKLSAVITQNIDGLHQDAGSGRVIELHGSARRYFCVGCGEAYALEGALRLYEASGERVPLCGICSGTVRPDVVLYGERLDGRAMREAAAAVRDADLLVVGGTSLAVYPAAGLLSHYTGKEMVLMNMTPTPYDSEASLIVRDPIGEALSSAMGMLG
ncbi:MAG: NAD-dependent protein deacylase [Oscillospiraceae bacterium]|nr:NAD-dependent protein deacylase [Oscillospiraceae bacterium]